MKLSSQWLKWCRLVHRDVSYFFAGMVLIYAISGLVMNHRDSINPNYSIERHVYTAEQPLPAQSAITKADVITLLEPIDEAKNYTKHYFPQPGKMKVFLKGGSNFMINLETRQVIYEKVTRRPVLSAMSKLHYNPGSWWTYFADAFAIALILITLTGLFMVKGSHGLWGRGGIELLLGLLVPLAFLLL